MGRLAGFRYRQIVNRLKAFGFEFDRQAAGSHEILVLSTDGSLYDDSESHGRHARGDVEKLDALFEELGEA